MNLNTYLLIDGSLMLIGLPLLMILKGKNVSDKGPIFKISKDSKKDLFDDYQKFDLMD